MRTSTFAAFTIAAVIGFSFAACNCGGGGGNDAGPDAGDCLGQGTACSTTTGSLPCCNGATCETNGGTDGTCGASVCKNPGDSCQVAGDCCGGRNCVNGVCSTSTCTGTGGACTSGTECCTTFCNGTTCTAIPGQGGACSILGEPCNPDAGAGGGCCSGVCYGGTCSPQFSCRASNDICTGDSQCCSLICNQTQADGGGVGTCVNPTGGTSCGVSGDPCTPGGSKCCTLACTNLGTGTTICQPTLGCKVQGDTCSIVEDCCGLPSQPPPRCDTNRCTNGTACRPAGDLCGKPTILLPDGGVACAPAPGGGCLTTTSETNCCNGNKVGGMETVCRVDTGGIPRCFGGQSGTCPFGYTGQAPCCIDTGNYCDFRDECCNGAICAIGADGGRQCLTSTCKNTGTSCTSTGECCTGLQCLPGSEVGTFCQAPQTQPDGGLVDGGCGLGNGSACTSPSQCCSRICDATGHCAAQQQCSSTGGACAGSGDCCQGLVCNLPAGSTNGTCGLPADGGTSCLNPGQTCSLGGNACCAGLVCVNPASGLVCDGTTSCACQVQIN